jgi:Skp family chaperone for outer membrane proteins
MKTTISFASAGLAILLAFPMTAQANDLGGYGSPGQRVAHRQEQPVEEPTSSAGARPAFENQQRLLQESQAEAEMYREQENRYQARDDRNYSRYREYREYRDDRQEGRNRRRNQRRYRQYQYRGDWR